MSYDLFPKLKKPRFYVGIGEKNLNNSLITSSKYIPNPEEWEQCTFDRIKKKKKTRIEIIRFNLSKWYRFPRRIGPIFYCLFF